MKKQTNHTNVLIIGSGPAGLTAAIYTARACLNPILIAGPQLGGQLTSAIKVENFPGFIEPIEGPQLMSQMISQAQYVGANIISDTITKIELNKRPFTCIGKETYTCNSLIIATGAQSKWLGLKSEKNFLGFGVSSCATCDGTFFKNKHIAIVGGGNTAITEALFLTRFASKVTIIHRRSELRAEKTLQNKVINHPKINILWESIVEEITGNNNPKQVTGLNLYNIKTKKKTHFPIAGVFIAIGHQPLSKLFEKQLDIDNEGFIKTSIGKTTTNIPGVFVAGDVKDKVYRQAITAAGQGCMAALDAETFLSKNDY